MDLKDVGDAWLLRNGYTVAALGWQWDATGEDALHLYAPIAKDQGKPAGIPEPLPAGAR